MSLKLIHQWGLFLELICKEFSRELSQNKELEGKGVNLLKQLLKILAEFSG
jgi:hypothetical protein